MASMIALCIVGVVVAVGQLYQAVAQLVLTIKTDKAKKEAEKKEAA